ncbi:MAG: class I SAM-dependent methyltransferase [bacterium]|nr:class I SAM-dependent methyltransferase [bacterium]
MSDRRFFALWERRGYHAIPVHFYSPIPEPHTLVERLWETESETVGIDWNDAGQLRLLADIQSGYKREYDQFPTERLDDPYRFSLANGSFGRVDAEMLYGMVRHIKPKHFVEIGSGHSTLLAAQALLRNEKDGQPGELVAIEPFPDARLRNGFPGLSRVIPKPVQEVGFDEFESLEAGDILFIDSSHVLKTGSDVQYEFLEILPRLRPGVLVHVHDIFLPAEYPREWVLGMHRFWNEQYILQAFLSLNSSFEVLWGAHYMSLHYRDELRAAFRIGGSEPPDASGGSFWIRRVR